MINKRSSNPRLIYDLEFRADCLLIVNYVPHGGWHGGAWNREIASQREPR